MGEGDLEMAVDFPEMISACRTTFLTSYFWASEPKSD